MFRRIISNGALLSTQTQRWQDLSKFACLRASLNKESEKAFQELAKKNNVSPQELVELSKIVSMNLDVLKQNINSEQFLLEKESTLKRYRQSSIGTRGHLQTVNEAVNTKYPTLAEGLGQVAGYKEAYQALREIFVHPSISVNNLRQGSYGQQFAVDFRTRADEYVKALLKDHSSNPQAVQTIQEIQHTLHQIIKNYEQNPASIYARILTVLQTRGVNTLPVSKTADQKAVATIQKTSTPSLTIDQLTVPVQERVQTQTVFDAELAFIKEANEMIQQNTGNLPWDGGKKKIFQGQANKYLETPYYLLAALSGLGLLYFLYSGDAKYKTLVLTPVVGIAAFVLLRRNQILNRVPTLTELFLHKDGKFVDAVVSVNGQLISKNDIPVSTLKLYRGDHTVKVNLNDFEDASAKKFLAQQSGQEGVINVHFSKLRNLAARNGQVLNLGDTEVVVPFENQANRIILKQIFKGVEVLPSS
ncbi:protein phosphatase 2C, putative (macronuclear) [Tetrahymena thermophila SB210]|uniref:Protein phosphatase 2C, putative n=1 Tax=Tetrahymena thermophila (strain SB210) TaxID=312017 RepID=Q22FX8_TETTS|nr:protein phosphatase 2C, putative [Tetrahymena thermophila SB210]7W5Z_B Chain B, Protein phosphatase 2C, putative [Tetrahymena thermophila]7W5Z_b Chain b, Protein phosphatase 2C, putative [Tetrahymena thermophila]8B6H_DO Chain DO, Protein phosphatase 2C, putative [Tetrahymena thermophila SB210]8B6H_Do Chain Do, Protein phosphatase 2C, putative [Tetrahymena thermophila SB210]8BQS_DO Chain DO, Protein phosphatase 2C, putative [Tetrahymena thermophila SB210]8BQS_Do Chain Do, Protein phosphatas|eukprot:XP_001031911.3 protein phosphatase 2C, putative [Tetrahymena thermophila SB210]